MDGMINSKLFQNTAPNKKTNPAALSRLIDDSQELGAYFSNNYADFLIEINGVLLKTCVFRSNAGIDCYPHALYGVDSSSSEEDIGFVNQRFWREIDKNYFLIGDDQYGNYFALALGDDGESLYFLNRDENFSAIHLKCSLNEFLSNIEKLEYDCFEDWVIEEGSISDLELLLRNTDNLNEKDEFGKTLLEKSAINSREDFIKYLHEQGAELGDALKYAEKNGKYFDNFSSIIAILKRLYGRNNTN